ncbi:uncharacterized protein Z520_07626 [Fonsecaea multimorphosa CBS 102226]|uniref:Proteophosphoglycan 5 n=1 Tax=Fonsecaea multimorphosa CBS 102226 TaxID=1442371 RepID=A0A0D2IIV2_9EURO|nr:uncharacterized protein Z520_07626 [Fonsecaea multimorphosa CBS 102226]KIX96906.1 hypothetical protein Z520_07626 [Fonsecaea multimorphosa CBS 102226]OAL22581.1 hypothetical protein AYO22_07139 [Fonsecaea multimorphosa]
MSAVAATPLHQGPRGPRRSGRKPRPSDALDSDSTTAPAAPAAEPQRNPSPAMGNTTKNNIKAQHRKPPQGNHKSQTEGKHGNNQQAKVKATPTPVKPAAYAGSAFQQSPAPSALPLPSFYSKSLPTTSSMPQQPPTSEDTSSHDSSVTPGDESPSKRESTPCDFLFEAARQARATPRGESPATRSGNLSVANGSPASQSPAPREGDPMFPFELEGGNPGEDGLAFATPYKDRIEALRSTKSTSTGGRGMDENERRAKSEALKKLLMKSSGRESGIDNDTVADTNPFNAKAPYSAGAPLPHGQPRSSSNPGTPVYTQENSAYHSPQNFIPVGYPFPGPQMYTPRRTNSSRLRHVYGAQSEPEYAELSSDSAITPPTASRKHTSRPQAQYTTASSTSQPQMPTHRSKPSAQQLEDDLRRVLKLDLTSRG